MESNHNENKEFLWNFLIENNIIKPQTQKEVSLIQGLFENTYNKTIITNSGASLIEKNKQFINGMVQSLSTLRTNTPYSKDEIKKERHMVMNKKFEGKQQEFSKLINAARPAEIDFSDKTDDDEVITKFKMDSTLAEREKELEEIMAANNTHGQKDAEKWINAGSNAVPQKPDDDLTNPPRLDIKTEPVEGPTDFIELTNETNRKVSFSNDVTVLNDKQTQPHNDFLSKLKPAKENISLTVRDNKDIIKEMREDILEIKESMNMLSLKVEEIMQNK